MANVVSSKHPLTDRLFAAGIIPKRCRKWELVAEVHKPVVIRSEVFVSPEEYERIVDALLHLAGEDVKSIAHEIAFKTAGHSQSAEVQL